MKSTAYWVYALVGVLIVTAIIIMVILEYQQGLLSGMVNDLYYYLNIDQYINFFD